MKVYLAGGLRNNWQDKVIATVDAEWLDPRILNTESASLQAVALQEMDWLRECDVVFAYLEADNPSGLGLAVEVGFARALGKVVVFVDEHDSRYSAFVSCFAIKSTGSLAEAIHYLQYAGRFMFK